MFVPGPTHALSRLSGWRQNQTFRKHTVPDWTNVLCSLHRWRMGTALITTRIGIASLLGLALWVFSVAWGVHLGCGAYIATPNVEPFEVLAETRFSGQVYGASKMMYLFGPMLFACIVALVLIPIRTEWLDRRFGPRGVHDRGARIVAAVVLVSLMIAITAIHSAHATSALHGAHFGQTTSIGFTERICTIAG